MDPRKRPDPPNASSYSLGNLEPEIFDIHFTPQSQSHSHSQSAQSPLKSPARGRGSRKSKMAPFRDEHVLIIAPGSHTTHAQLGLPESLAPAQHKLPTRMFLGPDGKKFEPYKVKAVKKDGSDEEALIEYPDDEEGAIWPLQAGRIDNMDCFLAFLHHVHTKLQPGIQSPLVMVAQPNWTAKDQEDITRFIFETFKVPAFLLIDAAISATYGYGIENGTVINVGFEKVDISAVHEFQVASRGGILGYGGDNMTEALHFMLQGQYEPPFTREMAEKLKQSNICEVMFPNHPLPGAEGFEEEVLNPAAAASTGAATSGPAVSITAPLTLNPEPGVDNIVEKDDGVLDIANIVASGKTQEFLAKAEKAKAEKAAAKKATKDREAAEAAAIKTTRIPNAKRFHNTWIHEAVKPPSQKDQAVELAADESGTVSSGNSTDAKLVEDVSSLAVDPQGPQKSSTKKDNKKKQWEDDNPDLIRHEYNIGPERLMVVDHWFLDRIADEVYRVVQGVRDIGARQSIWENLIICGGGARIKGFREVLLQVLLNRYLISPSSATMFTSELPSNIPTPSGTGSMTPNASFGSTPHGGGNQPNSLLIAATTASNPALNPNLQSGYNAPSTHSSHSQTPTAIKLASAPTYLPEYKDFYDIDFLGACVAAKTVLIADGGATKGLFVTRNMYNEDGPGAIHQIGFCG